jgi:hypothetical protein
LHLSNRPRLLSLLHSGAMSESTPASHATPDSHVVQFPESEDVTEHWRPLEGHRDPNGFLVSKAARDANRRAYAALRHTLERGEHVVIDCGELRLRCLSSREVGAQIHTFSANHFYTIVGAEKAFEGPARVGC